MMPVFESVNIPSAHSPEAELSLSAVERMLELRHAHERMHPIARTKFDHYAGTLLLELNSKRALQVLLEDNQCKELKQEGFAPLHNPHITVLNFSNASRIIDVMDRQRRRLAAVAAEADRIDWSWRPTGIVLPLRTKRSDGTKVVSLVDCPGAEHLFEILEDKLPGLNLERQPMHVSLMRKKGESRSRMPVNVGGMAVRKPQRSLDFLIPSEAAA
jgi:hypothetical protein